jgi:hypothetical protein
MTTSAARRCGTSRPGTDHRLQLRFPVERDDLHARLATERATGEVAVADVSMSGAALLVGDAALLGDPRHATLDLRSSGRRLGQAAVDLVHVQHGAPAAHLVGVRFRGYQEEFLRRLCRYLVERHAEQDRAPHADPRLSTLVLEGQRVKGVLERSCQRGRLMTVLSTAGIALGRLRPARLDAETLEGPLELAGPLRAGDRCLLALPALMSLHLGPSVLLSLRADGTATFTLPQQLFEGGLRRLGRLSEGDDFAVDLEFIHPQVPGKFIRKRAREVGLGGLSFWLDVDEDLLVTGSVIDSAIARLPGGRSVACRCVVRHVLEVAPQRYACGVELSTFHGAGRQVWVDQLLARMNPHIEEVTPFGLDVVWEIFSRSGYLAEKPEHRLEGMREPFLAAWQRLLGVRDGSRLWLCRHRDRPIATVGTSRIYSSTWLLHHLAADLDQAGSEKRLLLSELLPRTLMQWLAGAQPRSRLLGYVDAEKPFNHWLWSGFFSRHARTDESDVREIKVREMSASAAAAHEGADGVEVSEATEEELPWISGDLLRRDGPFLHDAFDYPVDRILLASLMGTADGPVLGRQRTVLAARRERRLVGYALVELGAHGANIFSLYDTCRMVLVDGEERRSEILVAMLAAAARHYLRHDRSSFLYLSGPGDAPPPEDAEAFDAVGMRAVVSGDMTLGLLRHLDSVLSGERT